MLCRLVFPFQAKSASQNPCDRKMSSKRVGLCFHSNRDLLGRTSLFERFRLAVQSDTFQFRVHGDLGQSSNEPIHVAKQRRSYSSSGAVLCLCVIEDTATVGFSVLEDAGVQVEDEGEEDSAGC